MFTPFIIAETAGCSESPKWRWFSELVPSLIVGDGAGIDCIDDGGSDSGIGEGNAEL